MIDGRPVESDENARMLNKESRGMRDLTVWCIRSVGLTWLHDVSDVTRLPSEGLTVYGFRPRATEPGPQDRSC